MCPTCTGPGPGSGLSYKSVPPVQVLDPALLVPVQQAQQLLVFPVQAQVVGGGEGLQGQTGEGLHLLEDVQLEAEVVPRLHPPCHHLLVLITETNIIHKPQIKDDTQEFIREPVWEC